MNSNWQSSRLPMPSFTATEEFNGRGKWTSLLQSAFRVHLTCPECNHRYPIVHAYCGLHVLLYDALSPPRTCQACLDSGHKDDSLPEDIADCPRCGLQCRSVEQVIGSNSIRRARPRSSRTSSPRRQPPRIKGQCSKCGSAYGVHTHHIDWNHDNNEKSNLTTLCHHCHEQVHKLGKPLFDQLGQRTADDPDVKQRLSDTSLARHQELYGRIAESNQLSLF